MLKIRLQRTGRKNEPTFRFVLTDSKNSTKSGRFLEVLGHFDSRHSEQAEIKTDRVLHWMSVGAQVTPTIHNLLVTRKIIASKKVNSLPKKSAPVKEAVAEAVVETPAPVAPAPSAAPEEVVVEPMSETSPEVAEVVAESAPEVSPEVVA